jgi:hypothetical protein
LESQKIFISYSRADGQKYAVELASKLRAIKANVWIDVVNIPPGKKWDHEIEIALDSAGIVLFIATQNSTTSDNVLNELNYAIDEKKEIIPVKFHDCRLPLLIQRFQYIDFRPNCDYAASFERLKTAIGIEEDQDEKNAWQNAVNKNTIAGYENYLNKYPNGSFSVEANNRINGLNRPQKKRNGKIIMGIAVAVLAIAIVFFAISSRQPIQNYPGNYPQGSARYLVPTDVTGLNSFQLKIMRNEIFARHDFIFKTKDMIDYFNSQNWYHAKYDDVTSALTEIENYNVDFIKKYEK